LFFLFSPNNFKIAKLVFVRISNTIKVHMLVITPETVCMRENNVQEINL